MRGVNALAVASFAVLALSGCERGELDRQMEVMCKKDGGMKVYETVTLPASYFEPNSQRVKLGPLMPWGVNKPGSRSHFERIGDDEYRYLVTRTVVAGHVNADLEHGEGRLTQRRASVYRTTDGLTLGESISYERGGGDGITFGFQPSGNECPLPRVDLLGSVFFRKD